MGWGIRIPSLGVDTRKGEYFGGSGGPKINIGGDIGKALNIASTPATIMGAGGLFNYMKNNPGTEAFNPTDFSGLTSRWNNITEGFTGQGLRDSLASQEQQAGAGVNNSLATLGQFGGQSVGAADRLNRQSKWNTAMGESQAVQDANISKFQTKQQGILGLDLPIAIGKEQADAQARAARSRAGASRWGMLGGLAGGIAGGAMGGPTGAAAGFNFGTGVGQNFGSNI